MTVLGCDVSFWQDDDATSQRIDFKKMRAAGARFVFIRAGQGDWVDPDFAFNWRAAEEAGLLRGAYWFYDYRKDPVNQANLFVDTVGTDTPEIGYAFDVEESPDGPYKGFTNWKKHIDRIVARVGIDKVLGYSRATFINEQNFTPEQIAYLRKFLWWFAHYYDPPVPDLPNGWLPGEWLFHQYTDRGPGYTFGVESSRIDLDRFNGDEAMLYAMFGTPSVEPPPSDVFSMPLVGVEQRDFSRFGTECHALIVDPKVARIHVTDHFNTVSEAVAEYQAQAGINGDGWGYISNYLPNSVAYSDGKAVQPFQYEQRPWANITKEGVVSFAWQNPYNLYNAVSGDRYLVQGGQVNQALYSRYQEKNARTCLGQLPDGRVVLFVCDGDDTRSIGLAWVELANVLIELGCVTAINLDGGGSTAMVVNGQVVNKPNDDGVVGQRRVVNQVLVFADIPQEVAMNYEVVTPIRPRPNPSRYSVSDRPNLVVGYKFASEITQQVTELGETTTWVQLPDGYWAPLQVGATVYIKGLTAPPPPASKLVARITVHYDDGTEQDFIEV